MPFLRADAAVPPEYRRDLRYPDCALLFITYAVFRSLDKEKDSRFFLVVSNRYERASIMLTASNGLLANFRAR